MPRGERIAKPAEGDPARPVFVFGAAGPCSKAARRARAGGSLTAQPIGRLIPPADAVRSARWPAPPRPAQQRPGRLLPRPEQLNMRTVLLFPVALGMLMRSA